MKGRAPCRCENCSFKTPWGFVVAVIVSWQGTASLKYSGYEEFWLCEDAQDKVAWRLRIRG